VISREPGAPAYGDWSRIRVPDEVGVVCGTLGPLSTRELLKDRGLLERSGKFGGLALKALVKNPTPQEFMRVSREFAEGLGLLDDELRVLIEAAETAGAIGASQVMLGRAVFALVKNDRIGTVKRAFLELLNSRAVMVTGIASWALDS
jgi:pantoate kinase